VWRKFGVLRSWRKPQGLILGERCGITQNIGPAARKGVTRLKEHRLRMGYGKARPVKSRRAMSSVEAPKHRLSQTSPATNEELLEGTRRHANQHVFPTTWQTTFFLARYPL
jgi:hypothetical protein